ncbi:DsbA family protein [Marinobacterium jannaschii]|uniref:DsbA family protein n=1 Tax=Marinobacterium jannaschii TaxID=64970 RepID=UPI00048785AC|nr:thioredoxin domain-containing protein [Marinobacterium jannaschii]
MTRQKLVLSITVLAIVAFAAAAIWWQQHQTSQGTQVEAQLLERSYSPSLGPADARVTIVEFFDPACETCRAIYPYVKQIMAQYPDDVRLVLRYTTFHQGSDEVVRILEAARRQELFLPVLEVVLARQSQWASHGAPDLSKAWEAAALVGLDIKQARAVMMSAEISAVLAQDAAGVEAVGVEKTPTFFVNGKPLLTFGVEPLVKLVQSELAQ